MANLLYDLESIRGKMKKKKGGGFRDPNEWRPDKAEAGKLLKYKFFILPPVDSMDLWYYQHGQHWIEKSTIECPRIHDGENCPLCQFGFDLMKDTEEKAERSKIAKNYLASARYAVNIYFPPVASTPVDLRGKVMWFSMPQSVYQIMENTIMHDPDPSEEEMEAHGIFFDPSNAFPFVLEVKKKGEFNSYESSKFLGKQTPISKGGEEKIAEILDRRHDIPTLHPARDVDALQAIVDNIQGNGVSKPAPAAKETPKAALKAAELKPEPELEDEEEIEESVSESKVAEKAEIEVEDDDLSSLLNDLNAD